jgi:hypothetical protein
MSTARWYEVTHKDGSRHLARRADGGLVVVMARRGLSLRTVASEQASRDYERGAVYHDQRLADEQYRLARSLAEVTTRIRGGRYDVAA